MMILDQNRTGDLENIHGFLKTVHHVSVLLKAPFHFSPERTADYRGVLNRR